MYLLPYCVVFQDFVEAGIGQGDVGKTEKKESNRCDWGGEPRNYSMGADEAEVTRGTKFFRGEARIDPIKVGESRTDSKTVGE